LEYFLEKVLQAGYVHLPILAPTQAMLDAYKKNGGDWETYTRDFVALMASREIERNVPREVVDGGCLLCSEEKPHHCHRRLVAEYLQGKWGGVEIRHLGAEVEPPNTPRTRKKRLIADAETLEILADPAAMKAIREHQAGKTKFGALDDIPD